MLIVKQNHVKCRNLFSCSWKRNITQEELLETILWMNENPKLDGILVQFKNIWYNNCFLKLINPLKDVDGFHPYNVGRMVFNLIFLPATPFGVMRMFEEHNIELMEKMLLLLEVKWYCWKTNGITF